MIKVAVIGPESTGKSELCKELARHFNTDFIPEYSREYLEVRNGKYEMNDLVAIARGQKYMIDNQAKKMQDLLISDTEGLVVKVWSKVKYGEVDPLIEVTVKSQEFDLYLLCNTDLEWASDPLREVPSQTERDRIFEIFRSELEKYGFRYDIVSGTGNQRLKNAISFVEKVLP